MVETMSKYGQKRFIEKTEDGHFIIYGESEMVKIIEGECHSINSIQYDGGPIISVGMCLFGKYKIDRIYYKGKEKPCCYKLIVSKL